MCVGAQSGTAVSMPWVSMTYHCHPEHIPQTVGADAIGTGGTVSRRTTNKKLAKLYWLSRKRSPKRLNVLLGQKCRGTWSKKIPAAGRVRPTFKFVQRHWPQTQFHIRPTNSGFSKLALVKSKLHSTMGQQRLEALLLASEEKDVLLELDNAELVTRIASKSDRLVCNATELGSYCMH